MEITTWHFTLSALAQSLAAVLGLTSIFIVLKLEHVVREIDYHKRRGASILKFHPNASSDRVPYHSGHILCELRSLYSQHADAMEVLAPHLGKALKKYEPNIRVSSERSIHFLEDTISSLEDHMDQKHVILKTVRIPVVITISDIIVSLICLAFSDFIFLVLPFFTQSLLVFIVLWGVVGIIGIAQSSYQLLSSVE